MVLIFKVAFSDEGKIQALDLLLYNNGGYSLDLTYAVSKNFLEVNNN